MIIYFLYKSCSISKTTMMVKGCKWLLINFLFPRDLGRIDFCSRLDLGVIWCNWISAFVTQPAYFCICCFGPQKNHKVNSDILFWATAVHTLSSMCYEVTYNLWILKYDIVNIIHIYSILSILQLYTLIDYIKGIMFQLSFEHFSWLH